MVVEIAMLEVKEGQAAAFEAAFAAAGAILTAVSGCLGYDLARCVEAPNRYALSVRWRALEDHTQGFRGSPQHQEFRRLLGDFYASAPAVQHFRPVRSGAPA